MKWTMYGRAQRSAYKNQWVIIASGNDEKSQKRAEIWWNHTPVWDEIKTEFSDGKQIN